MRLADLVGQDTARTALLRAIERGHLAHAYLFDGPAGVGKRGAALGLAMALNCTEAPGSGCGACEVCRRIEAGLHPDVPRFGPSGPGGQIVIDDARTIQALARSRPHEAAARVIVVEDADAMNPNAANCLLKTLEEPLARNHLVLCTTAPDRLLPTIRSRTQSVRFRPLPAAQLLELARRHGLPEARGEIAATLADGSAARLFALATDDGGASAQTLAALRAAVTDARASAAFDFAAAQAGDKSGKAGKDDLGRLLELTARLYRDAIALAAGAPELAVLRDGESGAGALAALGAYRLNRALAAIVDAQEALLANVNPTLAIERMLIALKRQERPAA
ncbi:MAG TPA: DNA polymerase III subunit delta' [Polyangia bacterium]|jgi:DNA polymerase-3 subunit delta'